MAFGKFELFIANRFIRDGNSSGRTRPVIRISIIAIAVSTAAIILTAAVVNGFKNDITEKVIGFSAHIEVSDFRSLNAYETKPIDQSDLIESLAEKEEITHVQTFVTKPVLLKNGESIQANVLKGVQSDFDPDFFQSHLVKGEVPEDFTKSILISKNTANILEVDVGDDLLLYFIQDPPRMRKLEIKGIYQSGFAQFDDLIALCDMRLLQKINGWGHTQYSGYELYTSDFSNLESNTEMVYNDIAENLNAQSIFEKYPDIFNWLELQDVNYYIILILMILVAVINCISALIILILERAPIIGMLKTMGSSNGSIKSIFIFQGMYILLKGLFWGNLIGIGLAFLQSQFKLISLPVESYYLSHVPISLDLMDLGLVNLFAFVICMLALIIPSHLISGIVIAKVIKLDN